MIRQLILSLQFWTRLPTPPLANISADEWSTSLRHAVPAGLIIGLLMGCLAFVLQNAPPWLAAWLLLLCWCWMTGGLHLDGLADLADALGAAHTDKGRLMGVFHDPHLGSFGAITLFLLLSGKLLLLMLWFSLALPWWVLILIPAWARWGSMWWACSLPSLFPGRGADYAAIIRPSLLIMGFAGLFLSSLLLYWPLALTAPAACVLWWWFLNRRLGGMNGDCLGAGIECCELLVLLTLVGSGF